MNLLHRLAAPAVAVTAVLGLAIATAPVADAVTPAPIATTLTLTPSTYNIYSYGGFASFEAKAAGADGSTVYEGSVQIQTSPAGANTWTTVATENGFGYWTDEDLDADIDVRAVYLGHTGTDPTYDKSYSASTSATYTVHVQRGQKLVKETKKVDCFKVGPTAFPYKNKPIKYYFLKGTSKKWHFGGSQKTNKHSEYCVRNPKKHHIATTKSKGPKHGGFKTVYVKAGGMAKHVEVFTW